MAKYTVTCKAANGDRIISVTSPATGNTIIVDISLVQQISIAAARGMMSAGGFWAIHSNVEGKRCLVILFNDICTELNEKTTRHKSDSEWTCARCPGLTRTVEISYAEATQLLAISTEQV